MSYACLKQVLFKGCKLTVVFVYGTGLSSNGQNPTTSRRSRRPRWKTLGFWTSRWRWATRTSTVTKETANIWSSSQMSGRLCGSPHHNWSGASPVFKDLIKYPPSYYSAQQWCIEGTARDDKSLNERLISLACHQFSFPLKIFIASGGPVRSSSQNQAPEMFLEIHHQEELLVPINPVFKSCKTV